MDLALTLLAVVLGSLAVIVGLVLILLLPRFDLTITGAVENTEGDGEGRISWFFGALQIRVRPGDGIVGLVFGRPVHRFEKGPDRESNRKPKIPLKAILNHRTFLRELFGRFFDACGMDGQVWGSIGLSRPDRTAALAQILTLVAKRFPAVVIDIGPDYSRSVVDLSGHASVRFWPPRMLAIALLAAFSEDGRDFIRQARAS